MWVKGTAGGLDKRQATVQLGIFVDGIIRVKPLLDFRGKGIRITAAEKSGCTSLVQPPDVSINKPFKGLVEEASEQHYYAHTKQWMNGKITASERRVLISQWVGEAWEALYRQHKDTIIYSFRKYGISLPIDGSQNSEIHIEGITAYKT